jgi:hypothetical protein
MLSDAEKIPSMRAVISLEGGDHVAVDALPMNLRREIREGFAQALVEGEDAGLVASTTRLAAHHRHVLWRRKVTRTGSVAWC